MLEAGNKKSDAADDDEEAAALTGMQSMTQAEAERLEQLALEREKAEADAPIGETKLKVFKEKARKDIEERLSEKRKRRRLMKGGHSSTDSGRL